MGFCVGKHNGLGGMQQQSEPPGSPALLHLIDAFQLVRVGKVCCGGEKRTEPQEKDLASPGCLSAAVQGGSGADAGQDRPKDSPVGAKRAAAAGRTLRRLRAGQATSRTSRCSMLRQAEAVARRGRSGGLIHKDILTNSTIFPQMVSFRTGLRPAGRAGRLTSGHPTREPVARLRDFLIYINRRENLPIDKEQPCAGTLLVSNVPADEMLGKGRG